MKNRIQYIVVLALLVLYVFGANGNSSLDAWAYAANVQQGQNLLQPHHLLYNLIGFIWVKTISLFFTFETIVLLKFMNAVFAALALVVFQKILVELKVRDTHISYFLIFAGASWGVMRFAIENETYIVPLMFSLLGSLYFIRAIRLQGSRYYVLAGFFAAVAILFHQVMFFWWLALLVGVICGKNLRHIAGFAISALMVLIAYGIVVYIEGSDLSLSSLVSYALSDYMNGSAGLSFDKKSFLLLAISTFRTFFQLHGYIGILLVQDVLWNIAAVFVVLLLIIGLVLCLRSLPSRKPLNIIFYVHLLALLLQLAFAEVSDGNAEFLVMLPFLCAILLTYWSGYSPMGVKFLLMAMLVWNVVFGVVPLKTRKLDSSSMVVNHIVNYGNPCCVYIVHDKPRVENELNYRNCNNGSLVLKPTQITSGEIDTMLVNGYSVFTDIVNRPKTYSRERIVGSRYNPIEVLNGLRLTPTKSNRALNGRYFLYKVVDKDIHNY